MKKLLLTATAAICVAVLAFAGCANVPTQTPAQIAANLCPGIQSEIGVLQTSGVFTGGAQATLTNQVQPDVNAVCAAGATVTTANIRNLVSATFPIVIEVIQNSSLNDTQKLQATVAVGLLATGINTALQFQPAPVQTVPQTTPASAPVVAAS